MHFSITEFIETLIQLHNERSWFVSLYMGTKAGVEIWESSPDLTHSCLDTHSHTRSHVEKPLYSLQGGTHKRWCCVLTPRRGKNNHKCTHRQRGFSALFTLLIVHWSWPATHSQQATLIQHSINTDLDAQWHIPWLVMLSATCSLVRPNSEEDHKQRLHTDVQEGALFLKQMAVLKKGRHFPIMPGGSALCELTWWRPRDTWLLAGKFGYDLFQIYFVHVANACHHCPLIRDKTRSEFKYQE